MSNTKTRIEYPNATVFYPKMGVTLDTYLVRTSNQFALNSTFTVDLESDRCDRTRVRRQYGVE